MRRQRSFYGCSGYKDGCKFSVNISLCGRVISVAHLKELTETGRTAVIQGFVSPRTGKTFEAALKLENGRAVFDFEKRQVSTPMRAAPMWNDGEEPPLPEPPQ
jgi:DNA topoisomerase-3